MELTFTTQFKKDAKKAKKQNKDFNEVLKVSEIIMTGQSIPPKYKDHSLVGNYLGHRELHIEPDWLLIYKLSIEELRLVRLGSHSELFG